VPFHGFIKGQFPFATALARSRGMVERPLEYSRLDSWITLTSPCEGFYELLAHNFSGDQRNIYCRNNIGYYLPVDSFPKMGCCSCFINHFDLEPEVKYPVDKLGTYEPCAVPYPDNELLILNSLIVLLIRGQTSPTDT